MALELFLDNLLSPPVLFFFLGIAATLVRSDLSIPEPITKLFSLYLLWAIGFKGGVALRESGLAWSTLTPVLTAVALSAVIPLLLFPLLRLRFKPDNACAIAASYGSVSVVTFVTAVDFIEARGIAYGGEMIAALALMESPPIIVALILRRLIDSNRSEQTSEPARPLGSILHEALTSGPVFLLLGSLVAGALTGPSGFEPLRPFTYDIFHGVLVLFLLEAGIVAGERMRQLGRHSGLIVAIALVLPLINAGIGIAIAALIGLDVGNALLFTILSASASYIAVPAVMRLSVPEANAGIYLPMSLGVTFPLNVCIGIPLYLGIIERLWTS